MRAAAGEARAYLGTLDREELLRAFLIADGAGYGGCLISAPEVRGGMPQTVPPLRVLRGHALDSARAMDARAPAPFGHDLAAALASGRAGAIAFEAEVYLRDILSSGAAIVVESPLVWRADLSGELLDLGGSRLRRLVRWVDPRRTARTPLQRAAAQAGSLAERFAATAAVGGVAIARNDTAARVGNVQWRPSLHRDVSDSVFQVSERAVDWPIAEAIYTSCPAQTLDSLRGVRALSERVLRRRLLPMTTLRMATRRLGGVRPASVDRMPGDVRANRERERAGAGSRLTVPRPVDRSAKSVVDTTAFRIYTRRVSASKLSSDAASPPWRVGLDTVLVVNASGLRSADLRLGLGVYGPARWVGARAPSLDSLIVRYTRTVLLAGPSVRSGLAASLMSSFGRGDASDTVAAVVVGAPSAVGAFRSASALLYQPSADIVDWRRLYAGLYGGRALGGVLPAAAGGLIAGSASPSPQTRVAPLDPITAGLDVVQLTDIDAVMREAVKAGAFPGGQVSIVYDGQLVYDKAFGSLAPGDREVDPTDLYDLASLTKVASTTLAVMRLYERGAIELDAPLSRYLDGLPAATGRLRLRQLLRHHSGLPPSMPIYNELKRTRKAYHRIDCRRKYCTKPSKSFSVPVAHRVYYRASARNAFYAAAKQAKLGKRKRYSDLNFFLLQQVVERVTGESLAAYVRAQFYAPLGLALTYRPLERYGRPGTLQRVAPTEYDHKWRRQRLRGDVHDEAAALQGGVGGHAGLFGSARDVAVLFAMLRRGGSYGGVDYLRPETIDTFTRSAPGEKHALGFAKAPRPDDPPDGPRPVFGHTGFTGTSVWTDAEAAITVAFTSNRIYRGRANWRLQKLKVREQISRIVYDALSADPLNGDDPIVTKAPAL